MSKKNKEAQYKYAYAELINNHPIQAAFAQQRQTILDHPKWQELYLDDPEYRETLKKQLHKNQAAVEHWMHLVGAKWRTWPYLKQHLNKDIGASLNGMFQLGHWPLEASADIDNKMAQHIEELLSNFAHDKINHTVSPQPKW